MRIPSPISILVVIGALALLITATGCSSEATSSTPETIAAGSGTSCGVSELKANPEKYLGPISITGKAARVFPGDGVVEIADEKACCAVYLFVPFTEEQRTKLSAEHLYTGTLPAVGVMITADAELTKVAEGYMLQVKEIRSGDAVLVAMK